MTRLPSHIAYDHADLLDRARLVLAAHSAPAIRHISLEANGGRVTLRGLLPTYYERQLAVALVRRVAGVLQVIDELTVVPRVAPYVAASA